MADLADAHALANSPTIFREANILLTPGNQNLYEFMSLYRHISTFDIIWNTELNIIPEASHEQVNDLIQTYTDYPKLQAALRRMEMGNGPYLQIIIEDDRKDKYAHVLIAHGRTPGGARRIAICEFNQHSSINLLGVVLTLGITGLIALRDPAKAFAILIAKLGVDYGVSCKDVAIIAAIKALERHGFLVLNEQTGHITLI